MRHSSLLSFSAVLLFALSVPFLASADSSHARIVRLSLVQGEVRFAREFQNDPLTDPKIVWEVAPLNLPIRQGNVLSTGNGRAEVEFEGGAMAFLNANSILEFYDLSLDDGARITRLILRQGSASFSERSATGDYFSVTGGDFSVEITGHATFRLENFDNGSTVSVEAGRVNVLQNDNATPLEKGHSLSVRAGNPTDQVVTQNSSSDDFDRWVANRVQNEQVVDSQPPPSNIGYTSLVPGYADLFTYGSWMSVGGGSYWRPFGLGWGWNPFNDGNWIYDASIGWSFIGTAPWGWLPYHYGGWNFFPGVGWCWNPGGTFYGRPQPYRPVTAVFVKSGNTMGLVPMNVQDKSGKPPLNLTAQGIYPLQNGNIGKPVAISSTEKLSVIKSPKATELSSQTATVAAPVRVSRTIAAPNLSTRENPVARRSTIVYDANEHRFVNANEARIAAAAAEPPASEINHAGKNSLSNSTLPGPSRAPNAPASARIPNLPASTRTAALPPRPAATPAPARGSSSGWGGSSWGSTSPRSSGSSGPSSSHPSATSSGSTGGGRPH
jgi:FecR protein